MLLAAGSMTSSTTRRESTPPPFEDLVELVSHIVHTHHTFARTELAALFTLADGLVFEIGDRHPEIARIQELVCALADDLLPHMLKEERTLFPYLVALEQARAGGRYVTPSFGTVTRPIDALHAGHEIQTSILGELRKLTNDYEAQAGATNRHRALYDGLAALDRDLVEHIRLENEVAFPRAEQLERELMAPSRTSMR
jgi:regulator of cell morphogenesis and NO signaling